MQIFQGALKAQGVEDTEPLLKRAFHDGFKISGIKGPMTLSADEIKLSLKIFSQSYVHGHFVFTLARSLGISTKQIDR